MRAVVLLPRLRLGVVEVLGWARGIGSLNRSIWCADTVKRQVNASSWHAPVSHLGESAGEKMSVGVEFGTVTRYCHYQAEVDICADATTPSNVSMLIE